MTIGAGVVIRENTAAYGGGIFNERAGGVVTINGAEILYNTAEYGGGIFNEDALIINSATISYNEATLAGGGGIYTSKPNVANSNWHTDVLGGTISYNIAKTDGGGIYSNKANLTILTVGAGVVFENNSIGNAANVGIEAADQPTYDANIHATTWTVPFSNGYNNVDIAYTSVGTDSHPVQLVTFDTEGGSAVASVTVDPSGVLSKPTAPTKSNLYFAGWYTDDAFTSKYDFDLPVTTNLTLYAKWVSDPSSIQYDVFFDTMGGSAEAPEVMNYGNKAVEPVPPTLANKVFAGWYTDTGYTTKYNFNLPVESDLTLYAKWVDTEEEIEVAVFFEKNLPAGATDNITAMPITQYVPYSTNFSLLSSMVPTGSPASYTFVGWATTPTGSAVFKATMFNAGEGIYDASAGKIIMGLIYGNTSTIYALTSDVHLYAIWKAPSSGGSGSGSSAVSAIPLSGVTHSLSDFYLPMLIGAIMLATIRTANKRKYQ
ncbi:MAG: InlB B-repeat-containing protein [Erysipelotrichaceae bacterium]|jgi:uncharacterized repeat protein (TIGR02543 family)|nr:InlB B-repeat-containing protein [Erysipelotrichaceae bacterium]